MAIVLNPGKQQDQFREEMFCWNELPELLLADDLFGTQKDHLDSISTIISEDEDEDEDWDDDEEYEDEEFEDDDEEGEEFEEDDEADGEDGPGGQDGRQRQALHLARSLSQRRAGRRWGWASGRARRSARWWGRRPRWRRRSP